MKYLLALLLSTFSICAGNDLFINWNHNPPGESNQLYRVYISQNSTNAFTLAGSTTNNSLVISNVAAGTYGASITASNIWGESPLSPPVFTTGPVTVPSVPVGTTITIIVQ